MDIKIEGFFWFLSQPEQFQLNSGMGEQFVPSVAKSLIKRGTFDKRFALYLKRLFFLLSRTFLPSVYISYLLFVQVEKNAIFLLAKTY